MLLKPGARLGPYEIVAALGAGGMGEVYRARDTRLDRTVALKVVSPAWSDVEEGRRRFEREAKLVSQLSHPNVCALYDVGRAGDREYLVMEFVEGETLEARLARGPLTPAEIVRLGQSMASGLEAAHQQGVVHRDFKPGNVMLAKHGVKVLDFGLARALRDGRAIEVAETRSYETSAVGKILGTLPYMAPEQLQGSPVDPRADVFALGAVLYEMATGRRAFSATSQAGIIAAVLDQHPPPPSSVRAGLTPQFDRLIAQCLSKDPLERPQSAGEVARAVALIADGFTVVSAPVSRSRRSRVGLAWVAAGLAALAAVASFVLWGARPAAPAPAPISAELPLPPSGTLPTPPDIASYLSVSPDGRHLAFVLRRGDVSQLWLHSMETMEARPLTGTNGGNGPFWSPNGRHVAFFADGWLKRIAIDGDVVEQICRTGTRFASGSWGWNDTILFTESAKGTLMRVDSGGGQPQPIPSAPAVLPQWPHLLPDGRRFLVSSSSGISSGAVGDASLTPLLDARSSAQVVSGFLLYVREGALVAQAFDSNHGRPHGVPRVIASGLQYFGPTGGASFSASENGVLVYRPTDIVARRLVWIRRSDLAVSDIAQEAPWVFAPRLSPDGRHIVAAQANPATGSSDLWLHDVTTNTLTRLMSDLEVDNWPTWWPDSQSIVFARNDDEAPPHLFRRGVSALSPLTALLPGSPAGDLQFSPDVTPDGSAIVYSEGGDLRLWRPGGKGPEVLMKTPFWESDPAISADGRWLAYMSNLSGRFEIYVQPFGRPGNPVRISRSGGVSPRWRRDGREIFFLDLQGRIMAARVAPEGVSPAAPEVVTAGLARVENFDVSRDGQRFVAVLSGPNSGPPGLRVILNWEGRLR